MNETKKYGDYALSKACERISTSAPGNQHHTRLRESRWIGGLISTGNINESHALAMLEAAVRSSGAKDMGAAMETVKYGISTGKAMPIDDNRDSGYRSRPTFDLNAATRQERNQSTIGAQPEAFCKIAVDRNLDQWIIVDQTETERIKKQAFDFNVIAAPAPSSRADENTIQRLKTAKLILVATGNSRDAIDHFFDYWFVQFDTAYRLPCIKGSSIKEMETAGIILRAWIKAGIKRISKAEPPEAEPPVIPAEPEQKPPYFLCITKHLPCAHHSPLNYCLYRLYKKTGGAEPIVSLKECPMLAYKS